MIGDRPAAAEVSKYRKGRQRRRKFPPHPAIEDTAVFAPRKESGLQLKRIKESGGALSAPPLLRFLNERVS